MFFLSPNQVLKHWMKLKELNPTKENQQSASTFFINQTPDGRDITHFIPPFWCQDPQKHTWFRFKWPWWRELFQDETGLHKQIIKMSFNNPVNVLLLTPAVPVSWRGPRQYAVSLLHLVHAHEHRMTTRHSWHGPTWSLQLVTAGQLARQKDTHPFNWLLFQNNLCKLEPESFNQSGF